MLPTARCDCESVGEPECNAAVRVGYFFRRPANAQTGANQTLGNKLLVFPPVLLDDSPRQGKLQLNPTILDIAAVISEWQE